MKYFVVVIWFLSSHLYAQTPGLIVKPAVAGQSVLDPNADGYTSADNTGFSVSDETESEIPFVRLVLPNAEPTSDLATGPSCGFTDMVDNATSYSSAYTYLSGSGNWLFRFRLGNYATNSKGYSILIDTDGLFGATGALKDPNYVTGNPGFEVEIILVTNFGVRLNDVDGTTTPTLKTTLAYADYCQKSVALSANCSNPDYFYDFYIPFSTITTYFPSFTSSTSVRLVANTVISTLSALQGGPSDIAGINDQAYAGNWSNAWTSVVDASLPTAPNNLSGGFPPVRSVAPAVNSPLAVGGTSVSGTSSEANGSVITVYVNGVSVGTTTVSGGTWTLTGISALTLSAAVKATATATGKSVSYYSSIVTVGSTCSLVPSITCSSAKGIGGSGPSGAATGTTIKIYGPDAPGTLLLSTTTTASNTFLYNCAGGTTNCTGGGPNCIASGVFWVTAQESGKCESPKTTTVCIGTTGTASTPVITTNPILATTTSITGTATAGNTILLYIDNILTATTTATGGNWTFSSQVFTLGQVVSVQAVQVGACNSASATRTVSETSTAPVVTGPIITGATSVSGTSVEASGTTITIYKNGTSISTTTVDANGNWTKTGLTAFVGGDLIKATATATGEAVSAFSNTITVSSRSTAPAISGSYAEGAVTVSGTSSAANGTTITVYLDGVSLGTTTVAAGAWSLTGIGAFDLYPGGVLTATATESGKAESVPSASVTVSCSNPSAALSLNVLTSTICLNTTASIQVLASQSNVIYTLRNTGNTVSMGPSMLGTGGTITLASFRITTNQTFAVQAVKIPNTSCTTPLTAQASVSVTQPVDVTGVTSGDYYWTGSSSNAYWTNDDNWVLRNGSSFQTVTVPPTAADNVIIKPLESCIASQPSVVTPSSATIPAVCKNLTIASGGSLVLENNASERAITVNGNWSNSGTFTPNAGTIKFAGGTTQTISSASGSETFSTLIVEGAGTIVRPSVDMSVAALNLTSGVLDLNGHKVTISSSSSSAVVRTAGFVRSESQSGAGELRWAIGNTTNVNYVFPMGNASNDYIPVTLRLTAGNVGTAGVSTVFATQSSSSNWPTGSEAVTSVATPTQALRRYWHLASTQASGSYTATVTFSFASSEDPTATILDVTSSGIKMQRWNGTSWNTPLSGQTFSATSPVRTVSVPGITQFSWWSGGNANKSPLPVELLYFKGRNTANQVELEWATATETNCRAFVIERSADGSRYDVLGTLPGAGHSLVKKTYSFTDKGAREGFNYYRLKQVDWDGRFKYSHVVSIDVQGHSIFDLTAYPNPSKRSPAVTVVASRPCDVTIQVYDYLGHLHFSKTIHASDWEKEIHLEIPGFNNIPVGIYFIRAQGGGQEVSLKMIKD